MNVDAAVCETGVELSMGAEPQVMDSSTPAEVTPNVPSGARPEASEDVLWENESWCVLFIVGSYQETPKNVRATKKIEKVEIAWEYPPLVSFQDFSRSATDLYEHVSFKPSCVL